MFLQHVYKTVRTICLLCCLTGLASCRQVTQSISDTFHGRPENVSRSTDNPLIKLLKSRRDYLGDTAYLRKAADAFQNLPEFRDRKIMLYDKVYFYDDGRIAIKVQAADNPQHINKYQYDKKNWSPPQPVRLRSGEIAAIPEDLFPLDDLSFPVAGKVWASYNRAAAEKQGKPATFVCFIFQRDGRNSWWLPSRIEGARAVWEIEFDREGNVVLLEKK